MASAEGAGEDFRVFCSMATFDVIFLKFQGEAGQVPPPQFPAGTHAPMFTAKMPVRFVSQNIDIKF